MKNLIVISLLLLASTVCGEDVLTINDFRGLNTKASDFAIKPNEARIAHNIDFSRNSGSITKRLGYSYVSHLDGQDSILSAYAAYYSDGTQRIFLAADSVGVGYGQLWIGRLGSADFTLGDSMIALNDYWGVQGKTSFAMFDDVVYAANSTHRGGTIKDSTFRWWPPPALGEAILIPVSDTGGGAGYYINGQYRYRIDVCPFDAGAAITRYAGYVHPPVFVTNGRVLIRGLQIPVADSITATLPDSVRIKVYRSHANPGALDDGDSCALVIQRDTVSAGLSAMLLIDSIPDTATLVTTLKEDTWKGAYIGDSIQNRYGAPGYAGSSTDTGSYGSLYNGIPLQQDTLGVYYFCTTIDTITGRESDSGRSLMIYESGASMPEQITLNLPHLPTDDSGLVLNLYRGHILQLGRDTTLLTYENLEELFDNNMAWLEPFLKKDREWKSISPDTVVLYPAYLLAQISLGDSVYTDSIPYDSLRLQRPFTKGTPPPLLDQIFSHDGRMWGVQGSRLWYSDLINGADTMQRWGQMEFIPINQNDGDEITVAYPRRGVIAVKKNYSDYNVYQDANYDWSLSEVNRFIGCISPESYAAGLGGHYFLSADGVIRESDGMQLERTSTIELVSGKIDNIDKISLANRRGAVGFYYDRKYMLSFPMLDTTYVYDERTDDWATWSFTFDDAFKYGVESTIGFVPGDTMYFISGDSILRYGDSEYDQDLTVSPYWKSGPIGVSPTTKAILAAGLWVNSSDTGTVDGVTITVYDEDESSISAAAFNDLSSKRYHLKAVAPNECLYYNVQISASNDSYPLNNTVIDAVDIYWKTIGLPLRY